MDYKDIAAIAAYRRGLPDNLKEAYVRGFVAKLAQASVPAPPAEVRRHVNDVVGALGGGDNAKKLMLGTAATESNYGAHPNTYRDGYHGGMFQVDPGGFKATQDVGSHRKLRQHHETVKRELGVDWPNVRYEQVRNPRMSAIAARLFYLTKPDLIPGTRQGRAEYWKKHYNTEEGEGTPQDYLNRSHPDFSRLNRGDKQAYVGGFVAKLAQDLSGGPDASWGQGAINPLSRWWRRHQSTRRFRQLGEDGYRALNQWHLDNPGSAQTSNVPSRLYNYRVNPGGTYEGSARWSDAINPFAGPRMAEVASGNVPTGPRDRFINPLTMVGQPLAAAVGGKGAVLGKGLISHLTGRLAGPALSRLPYLRHLSPGNLRKARLGTRLVGGGVSLHEAYQGARERLDQRAKASGVPLPDAVGSARALARRLRIGDVGVETPFDSAAVRAATHGTAGAAVPSPFPDAVSSRVAATALNPPLAAARAVAARPVGNALRNEANWWTNIARSRSPVGSGLLPGVDGNFDVNDIGDARNVAAFAAGSPYVFEGAVKRRALDSAKRSARRRLDTQPEQ